MKQEKNIDELKIKVKSKEGKQCIYVERDLLVHSIIDNIESSDWGVRIKLSDLDSKGFTGEIMRDQEGRTMNVSASWEVFSYSPNKWGASYIGWTIYFNPGLVETTCRYAEKIVNLDTRERSWSLKKCISLTQRSSLLSNVTNKFLFPEGWIPAGMGEPWDIFGTYGRIPFNLLPPVDTSSYDNEFEWLPELDEKWEKFAMMEDLGKTFDSLRDSAKSNGIVLPKPFLIFFESPYHQNCMISVTDCYFELSDQIVEIPGGQSGFFIRFMNDSQGVMHWYLYIDGENNHRVAATNWMLDSEYPIGKSLESKLEDVIICSNSFVEFIYRFWIENKIWISGTYKLPRLKEETEYIKEVKKRAKKYSDEKEG
ncbi:MAG: hypothetical protein JW965_04075 [Bacteroidales bacterium]|nr:hypothetical protein [Bacteroidales bacterium]